MKHFVVVFCLVCHIDHQQTKLPKFSLRCNQVRVSECEFFFHATFFSYGNLVCIRFFFLSTYICWRSLVSFGLVCCHIFCAEFISLLYYLRYGVLFHSVGVCVWLFFFRFALWHWNKKIIDLSMHIHNMNVLCGSSFICPFRSELLIFFFYPVASFLSFFFYFFYNAKPFDAFIIKLRIICICCMYIWLHIRLNLLFFLVYV